MPRVSPAEKAKEYKKEERIGLDGKIWKSSQDKNGIFRWKKTKMISGKKDPDPILLKMQCSIMFTDEKTPNPRFGTPKMNKSAKLKIKNILTIQLEVSECYDEIVIKNSITSYKDGMVTIKIWFQKSCQIEDKVKLVADFIHGLHEGAMDGYLEGDDNVRIGNGEIIFDDIIVQFSTDKKKIHNYWY
jgi:hypothetical protein